MELDEVFRALREAVMLLNDRTLKFVETPLDDQANEIESQKEETTMELSTFVIRSFAETLLERYGKSKKEIEEGLKTNGQIYDSSEIPTGNSWHIVTNKWY